MEIFLGLLHICDICVAWYSYGFLTVGAGAVTVLTGFGELIPHTGLTCPALIQGMVLSLTI